MARVKRGVAARRRHKKLLKLTRGYKHGRKKLYRQAKQAWLKAGQHAYRDRRKKKRGFRSSWIVSINAAARAQGVSYRQLIDNLARAKVPINRKILAQLAEDHPEQFAKLVSAASKAATNASSPRPSRK